MDFFGFCLISGISLKSGGDDDAAELGGLVGGGRLGFGRVPPTKESGPVTRMAVLRSGDLRSGAQPNCS